MDGWVVLKRLALLTVDGPDDVSAEAVIMREAVQTRGFANAGSFRLRA